MAGQGTAKYLKNGSYKYVPYHRVFKDTEIVNVLNYGTFEVYPNRDSLKYRSIYGLDDVKTMIRGTMRRPGYCTSWNILVNLGLTDDSFTIHNSENITYRQLIDSFLPNGSDSIEKRFCDLTGIAENSDQMAKIKWLGLFEDQNIELKNASPATILQHLLEKKWKLEPGDKDMIVMQHQFVYEKNNELNKKITSLVVEGKDSVNTAMAITVGIPVAIATKLILDGKINKTGVHIPISKEIYDPILKELEEFGVIFTETLIEQNNTTTF
jgi:saccharopine dehydrogenase-like NADP-dependent oxidoreductase